MSLRRSHLSILLIALAAAPAFFGCKRQLEGERCSLTNADSDCEGDLLCTEAEVLREGADGVDRCCPPADDARSESSCLLKTTAGIGDGDGDTTPGVGGEGGSSGTAAPADLDEECNWTSDCSAPLVCIPSGKCQYECKDDRDCTDGKICSKEFSCEIAK